MGASRAAPRSGDDIWALQPARERNMSANPSDWSTVTADPRFQLLHRKKQAFLSGLMIFSVVYYFLLPIGAAYYQELFRVKVWGVINVGLLFALSEFVVAWLIAIVYAYRANHEFDKIAAELARDYAQHGEIRA
jgi:uncharacterized membrane protein (DUF485 family)